MPGTIITFTSGTGQLGGSVRVTNNNTGQSGFRSLGPNANQGTCAVETVNAAVAAGYQAAIDGFFGARITGTGIVVNVVGAFITAQDFFLAPLGTPSDESPLVGTIATDTTHRQVLIDADSNFKVQKVSYVKDGKEHTAERLTDDHLQRLFDAKIIPLRNGACTCGSPDFCDTFTGKLVRCMAVGGGSCELFVTNEVC